MAKHKGKCLRCKKLFLGLFGQKYCSTACRAAHWYTLKKSGNKNTITKQTEGIRLEVNDKNCPYCNGYLYTPAGQPDIIKCENININCSKGYWSLPTEKDIWYTTSKKFRLTLPIGFYARAKSKQPLFEFCIQNEFGLRAKNDAANVQNLLAVLTFCLPFVSRQKRGISQLNYLRLLEKGSSIHQ